MRLQIIYIDNRPETLVHRRRDHTHRISSSLKNLQAILFVWSDIFMHSQGHVEFMQSQGQ